MTAIAALMLLQRPAVAGPEGGTVVAGQAAISQAGPVTNVNQSSNKAIINWQGFSVAPQETVNFHQPTASSVTLNRVIGNETSVINGALNANGQVFIVNSAGVLFGKGSQVNVGGLVASTLDISNSDFMAGNYKFSGTSSASIVNQGRIRAGEGGYVALLGKTVSNEGVISARLGTVAMSAGEKITLNFEGNSLLDVTIDKGTLNALVQNKRAIRANGGQVIMTAKAADEVLSAQVNNTGIVQARSVAALRGGSSVTGSGKTGKIRMIADGGTTNVSGKLDASAPKGGDGGFIETSGNRVKIADAAVITTKAASGKNGTWLIDPTDFNIVAGSGAQTSSGIGATTLASNLGLGNVTIVTVAAGTENGDINVNAAVSWLADTILTLNAANDINVNQAITADGVSAGLTLNAGHNININNAVTLTGANATLAMNFGGYNGSSVITPLAGTDYNIRTRASYAGTMLDANGLPVAKQDTSGGVYGSVSFTNSANLNGLTINGQTYNLIHSISGLDALDGLNSVTGTGTATTVTGNYALAQSFDAAGTTYTRALVNVFQGTLTGLGHTVDNLTINAPTTALIGLIGQTPTGGGTIRDIGLVNANVTGRGLVGSLLGRGADLTTIANVYVTGSVTATGTATLGGNPTNGNGQYAGGLIGNLQGGSVSKAFAEATVSGLSSTGGLIGSVFATSGSPVATITNVHATGDVTMISQGAGSVGGLIGGATVGGGVTIRNAYATGDVSGRGNYFGGLVGNFGTTLGPISSLTNSFATGDVKTTDITLDSNYYGGLVGQGSAAILDNAYATGDVTAKQFVGGLVGLHTQGGSINKAFATGNVTGVGSVGGFAGSVGGANGLNGSSTITNAYATGNVSGASGTGGFVGANFGLLSNVVATGAVTGTGLVGGLAGLNGGVGTIRDSYATGNVTGNSSVGGLIGENVGTVTGSHAGGNVTGNTDVGGLIGLNMPDTDGGQIANHEVSGNYATGKVTGGTNVGGLFGRFVGGNASNNFWNKVSTGQNDAIGRRVDNGIGDSSGTKGLNNLQFRDLQYYLNGTINQVLTVRTVAVQTGSTVASSSTDTASQLADKKASNAGAKAMSAAKSDVVDGIVKSVQEQSKAEAKQRDERRKAAAARNAARTGSGGGGGGGYGATIRSIDVDGKRFDLEERGAGSSNNNSTPAPGGAAQ